MSKDNNVVLIEPRIKRLNKPYHGSFTLLKFRTFKVGSGARFEGTPPLSQEQYAAVCDFNASIDMQITSCLEVGKSYTEAYELIDHRRRRLFRNLGLDERGEVIWQKQ